MVAAAWPAATRYHSAGRAGRCRRTPTTIATTAAAPMPSFKAALAQPFCGTDRWAMMPRMPAAVHNRHADSLTRTITGGLSAVEPVGLQEATTRLLLRILCDPLPVEEVHTLPGPR